MLSNPRRTALFLVLLLTLAACGGESLDNGESVAEDVTSANAPVAGVQDGSIDDCDAFETYAGPGGVNYTLAARSMDSPLWGPLHVRTIRVTVPWDIAYHQDPTNVIAKANEVLAVEQSCLNYWLATVAAKGLKPEVSFKPDYNYRSPDGRNIMVPSIDTFRAAMQAFVDTYSCADSTCPLPPLPAGFTPYPAGTGRMARVSIIAPWGEPDFHSAVTAGLHPQAPQYFYLPEGGQRFDEPECAQVGVNTCGPVLAAQMWVVANSLCHDCTVIAGDFSSAGGLEPFAPNIPTYLDLYSKHLNGERPTVWGLHPYSDVEAVESNGGRPLPNDQTITARFSSRLRSLGYRDHTYIWFDEVSARYSDGSKVYGKDLENTAANYLMKKLAARGGVTAPGDPVVTQLYYMRFQDDFPAFSLVINGQPYPPYWTIQYRAGQ